jgi:FG-GAP-like repeat
LEARDLHGDGKADLILACDWDSMYIALNQGDGSFTEPQPLFDRVAGFPVVADLDGDGTPDIAALGLGLDAPPSNAGDLLVYLGLRDGGFSVPAAYTTLDPDGPPSNSLPPLVADFRGNGEADVVVQYEEYNGTFSEAQVFLALGDGGYAAPIHRAFAYTNTNPVDDRRYLAGDFDGDGFDDLVAVTKSQLSSPQPVTKVEVWRGGPDGSLPDPAGPYVLPPSNDQTLSLLSFRDLDGDGRADLVGLFGVPGDDGRASLRVLWQLPDGGFSPPTDVFSVNHGIYWETDKQVPIADLNGDGAPDLVVSGGSGIEVFLNACR